jgi:RNA polymerase sigma-70 factor (ECF subfamily)
MGNRVGRATQEALVGDARDVPASSVEAVDHDVVRLSFRQIFDAHSAAVGRTLRYLGVPESDLRDAAQEVFLVVDRRYIEFEGRSRLGSWIRQICVRIAYAYRRRRRRRREEVVAQPPERSVDAEQHTGIERRDQRVLLTRLLDALDDDHRAIIVLYEIEGLPMREVADILRCPLPTAYSRRKAGLDKLRDELDRIRCAS